jgi:hypothetical protein
MNKKLKLLLLDIVLSNINQFHQHSSNFGTVLSQPDSDIEASILDIVHFLERHFFLKEYPCAPPGLA